MRKIVLIFCVFAFSIAMPIGAQVKFTASVSFSGDCDASIGGRVARAVIKAECDRINNVISFNNCDECEQARMYFIANYSGLIDGYSFGDYYSCHYRVSTTPCTPCNRSDNGININILGPQQGSSFYSTNPANEVADWISDDIERQLALNPNYQSNADLNELNKAKSGLRNNSWYLDTDKPFVSINMRPDSNIHRYKERMLYEANQKLDDILKKSNMSIGQLKQFLNDCEFMLNNFIVKQNDEIIYLEKALLLAKFTVDYRATKQLISYEKLDGDKRASAAFAIMHDGKTQEDLHMEDLKKKEKELLEAGISQEVIEKIKRESDNTTLKDVFLGLSEIFPQNVLVVVLKDMVSLASDEKISDAISNQIEERKRQQEDQEKWNKEQQNKIQAIRDVVEATTNETKNKISSMSEKEMLDWSTKIDNTLSKMKQQSKDDYYGEFPDINKNKLIGRENVIYFFGNY